MSTGQSTPATAAIITEIQRNLTPGSRYPSDAYERDVTRLLDQLFPFSVLPGIRLFSSEPRGRIAYGYEMDNLLHVRFGEADYIVIVEAKKQAIEVERGRWLVTYGQERKCAREQVDNHIRTMWEYLKPIAGNTELRCMAVVVSGAAQTEAQKADGYRNAELHLCAIGALPALLTERFNLDETPDRPRSEVLRVPQSSFLDLLRLSLPVEQLGDPRRGTVAIMAMSAKQLENIRAWFNLFVEQFQEGDIEGVVRFRPPEFHLCRPGMALASRGSHWAALLVDEAHDLPPYATREIAEFYARGGLYLVVACDRHQKLRLAGSDAKIIEGLDFTNRSTRLRQVYRNPAPVYIASLGLMFRWFADAGPKVVPTLEQMREQFGFETNVGADLALEVTMRSDAHPANSWCHTVATFPDVAAAYAALAKEKMGHKEVLWVRFSEEDQDFDYELLIQRFTYHNCRSRDAYKISDKYIKGQDYPIVVIEGFPGFMDRFEAVDGQSAETIESRMWAFRRELYLCASRATTFLYFVCNVSETPEVLRIRQELQRLVAAMAMPEDPASRGTRSWKLTIHRTPESRSLDVFADTLVETPKEEALGKSRSASDAAPISVPTLERPQTSLPSNERLGTASTIDGSLRPLAEPAPISNAPNKAPTPAVPAPSVPSKPEEPPQRLVAQRTPDLARPTDGTAADKSNPGPTPPIATPALTSEKPKRVVVDLISGAESRKPSGNVIGRTPMGELLYAANSPPPSNPPPSSDRPSILESREKAAASSTPQTSLPPKPEPEQTPTGTRRGADALAELLKPRQTLAVWEGVTVRELAEMLGEKPFVIIGDLMKRRIFVNVNSRPGIGFIRTLCSKRGIEVVKIKDASRSPAG